MRALGTVLVMAALACAAHCRHAQRYSPWEHEEPARCRRSPAATAASCERVPPHNLLPHPADCELFYYCVSARAPPLCRQCPAGLHFNPRLRVCDYPAAAGCHPRDPRPTDPDPTDPPITDVPVANTSTVNTTSSEHVVTTRSTPPSEEEHTVTATTIADYTVNP